MGMITGADDPKKLRMVLILIQTKSPEIGGVGDLSVGRGGGWETWGLRRGYHLEACANS